MTQTFTTDSNKIAALKNFNFNPWVSRRKATRNEDGTMTLRLTTKTGTGRDMPGPITVPAHLVEEVRDCLYACGEPVEGKAEMVDGNLVMRLIFQSALWTDMQGNWFDYNTFKPVDKYGDPLKKVA